MKDIEFRLSLILTESDMKRLSFRTKNGEKIIVDVHGMKCYQAKKFINNIINIVRKAVELVIIHGFNHGTAIKDMITEALDNEHIAGKYPDNNNLGITHIIVKA